ncbi:ABC transporter substrate-binding protein [Leekyejoonella antrihumi]|uniref:ABC transporter substrate-binding protein n=1 Tax=Leekyejoonella antrihumi TaxID=1660198 RepID=A0A563E245_9MICO|nr:ABC transporter substrate-binding protein [Leekyejoonella antrihumi]TWP36465.1 ABC transporter substrate-binding protein [Leekyejoonella antrihumi]
MSPRRNRYISLPAGVALIAVMSGCGTSGGSAGSSLVTSGTSPDGQSVVGLNKSPGVDLSRSVVNAIASDPKLTAKVPAAVRTSGLQVSSGVGYPPMEMFASDGQTIYGIDPAIALAIGNRLGVKVIVTNADFNSQIPGVVSGRYNMIMSTMTDTAKRQKEVDFLDYLTDSQGFVVKTRNPGDIHRPADLCGKTVAVVDNGVAFQLAAQYSSDCSSAGKPAIKILKFTDDQNAILQVKSGRAVADINDYPVAAYRPRTGEPLAAVLIPNTASPLGIGMSKTDKPLLNDVRAALASLISDGTYRKILRAWGVPGMAVKTVVVDGGK